MNNYEYMKNVGMEQMSHYLCEAMEYLSDEEYWPCARCPMNEKCDTSLGGNGWLHWLKEEKK